MSYCKLQLRDEETQTTYNIDVTADEYTEIVEKGNITLATHIMFKQKEKENNNKSVYTPQTPDFVETPHFGSEELPEPRTVPLAEATSSQENTRLWTHEAIVMLISLYKKHETLFESSVKKYVWQKIAKELSDHFKLNFGVQQCDTKFKGLKNTYKTIKRHNDQSGNSRKDWKYFNLMDELLFSRPEINSPATCSSRVGLHVLGEKTNFIEEKTPGGDNLDSENTASFQSPFIRKRKFAENAVERRHREKMARQDRYLDILQRLTEAVEKSCPVTQNHVK